MSQPTFHYDLILKSGYVRYVHGIRVRKHSLAPWLELVFVVSVIIAISLANRVDNARALAISGVVLVFGWVACLVVSRMNSVKIITGSNKKQRSTRYVAIMSTLVQNRRRHTVEVEDSLADELTVAYLAYLANPSDDEAQRRVDELLTHCDSEVERAWSRYYDDQQRQTQDEKRAAVARKYGEDEHAKGIARRRAERLLGR